MKALTTQDYRDYIRRQIQDNQDIRGYQSQLAKAAGCQPSYLSQVLTSHVQLTPDHAAGLCRFWGLSDDESEYFITLVNLSRASSPHLKRLLEARLSEIRQRIEDLSRRIKKSTTVPANLAEQYYSAWYWGAIHLAVSVPALRTADAIASRMRLPLAVVQSTLAGLAKMGLIESTSKGWSLSQRNVHLPRNSFLHGINHANWRRQAVIRTQEGDPEGVHYTAIHALSRNDIAKLKAMILNFIEESRAVVAPSEEEDLLCISCDLFTV